MQENMERASDQWQQHELNTEFKEFKGPFSSFLIFYTPFVHVST